MAEQGEAEELVGKVLSGRYQLDAVIGEGGMGCVYRGTHLRLGRKVAVKVLRASFGRDSTQLDRFFQEARAAASVESSGVVDVMDLEVDGQLGAYIVMELLHGEPLTDVLRRGKLPPEDAIALIGELLDVLGAVHAHDIVHRDLKPPNVFLHQDEKGVRVVKVLDFGIAKVKQRHLTLTGEIVGTPRFMAPEQAHGEPLDQRTDLYAAGLLLYCCLSGKPPFDGVVGSRVLTLLDAGPKPLRELEPDLPEALHRVVERALSAKPADRFENAADMAAALRASLDTPVEAPPSADDEPSLQSRRSPVALLVVSFVLLAILLAVGLVVFRNVSLP